MKSQEPITPPTAVVNGHLREESPSRNWEIFRAIAEAKHINVEIMKGAKSDLRHRLSVAQRLVSNLSFRMEDLTAMSKSRNEKIAAFFDQMAFSIANNFNLTDESDLFVISPINPQAHSEDLEETILQESIGQFDREFKKYSLKAKEMQQAVKGRISKAVLSEELRPQDERVRLAGLALIDLANKIQKSAQRMDDKFDDLLKIVREAQSSLVSRKRPKINFFDKFLSFIQCSMKLRNLMTDYIAAFFEAYEVHRGLEVRRLAAIKSSFLEYLEIQNQFFGRSANGIFGLSQKMFEGLNEQLLSKNQFDIHLLLTPEEEELVLKTTSLKVINKSVLRSFFSKQIDKDEISNFLQSFIRKSFIANFSNLEMNSVEVKIYLTTDYYISIYKQNAAAGKEQLIEAIAEEDIQEIIRVDEATLQIKYIQRGIVWDTKKELKLTFIQPATSDLFNELREQSRLMKSLVGQKQCGSLIITDSQNYSSKNNPAEIVSIIGNVTPVKSEQNNENEKTNADENSALCDKEINNFSLIAGSSNYLDHPANTNESTEIDPEFLRPKSRTKQFPNNKSAQNIVLSDEVNQGPNSSSNSLPVSPSERV